MANPNSNGSTAPKNGDEWLCTKQVARIAKLSTSFFEQARSRGSLEGLPWYKFGGSVRYKKTDFFAWLETCRVTGGPSHD